MVNTPSLLVVAPLGDDDRDVFVPFAGLFSGIPRWRLRLRFTIPLDCTAVEPSAPYVVGSLPPVEEFSGPVYDQVHQELFTASVSTENIAEIPVVHEQVIVQEIPDVSGPFPLSEVFTVPVYDQVHLVQSAAGEMMENIVDFPVVHEQVIAQDIPEVDDSLPLDDEFTGPVYDQVHQELVASSEMAENFAEIPVVHEQVIVQDIPEVVVPLPPAQEFSAPVYGHVHQVFAGMRPERLVDARRPQRCGRTPPSVGAPVLAVQSLRGFDGVDNTAAKFLLRRTLNKKKEEEDKKVKEALAAWTARRKAVTDEMHALLDISSPLTPAQRRREVWLIRDLGVIDAAMPPSLPKRRKRKKKRKKKTPKTSSSRAIRAQNSGHCSTSSSSCCVSFPVFRPEMLGIMAGMVQVAFFRHVQGLVCWYLTMSLALCSSWLSQAQDARHHGWHGPQDSYRCSSWTRLSTCPLCAMCGVMVQTVQYTVWRFRCCSSSRSSTLPFDAQWQFPMVQISADHRDSPVRIWWSMSLFAGFPQVQSWIDG